MNLIKRVVSLPDLDWITNARDEIAASGQDFVSETDFIWQIGNVAVAGFMYHTLLSAPWMWFVLARGISIGDLLDFRRLAEEIPLGTQTAVRADYLAGLRFAKFYGFKPTGQVHEHGRNNYMIFRRA